MGRTVKNRTPAPPRPVEKVTVSTRHMGLRIAAVILLVAIGAASLSYGVTSLFSADPGWVEITANGGNSPSLAGNFTLLYDLEGGSFAASSEKKAVTSLYTQAAEKAWQLFNNDVTVENVPNIRWLNDHPNESVRVDAGLYEALRTAAESGGRHIYLAPLARTYDNLFYCTDDALTEDFDPMLNEALRAYFAETAAFARDESAVSIALLEDSQVCLRVSDAYLAYAAREEITDFVDFHWMLNAFAIDYIAGQLAEGGYTRGALSSFDGFARTLDHRADAGYSLNLYDGSEGAARKIGEMQYHGPMSLVSFRSYPLSGASEAGYYVRQDGEIRTRYLDPADGLNRASLTDLILYSQDRSCGEMAVRAADAYIAQEFHLDALAVWREAGIDAVYRAGHTLFCTDDAAALTLLDGYERRMPAMNAAEDTGPAQDASEEGTAENAGGV